MKLYSIILAEIADMKQMRAYHEDMIKRIDETIAAKEKYLKELSEEK